MGTGRPLDVYIIRRPNTSYGHLVPTGKESIFRALAYAKVNYLQFPGH